MTKPRFKLTLEYVKLMEIPLWVSLSADYLKERVPHFDPDIGGRAFVAMTFDGDVSRSLRFEPQYLRQRDGSVREMWLRTA